MYLKNFIASEVQACTFKDIHTQTVTRQLLLRGGSEGCWDFWSDANCLASASELKRAANGLQEMFWLLLPWSVISLGLNTHFIQDPSLKKEIRQKILFEPRVNKLKTVISKTTV